MSKVIVLVGCENYSVHGVHYTHDNPVPVEADTFKFLMTRRNDDGFRYFEEFVEFEEEEDLEPVAMPKQSAKKKTATNKASKKKKSTPSRQSAALKKRAANRAKRGKRTQADTESGVAI